MALGKNKRFLEIDTSGLGAAQVRLLNAMCRNLRHTLTVENEKEYFTGCAEILRTCAALLQQARFDSVAGNPHTPYSDQALEYSIEILQEYMENSKLVTYDN